MVKYFYNYLLLFSKDFHQTQETVYNSVFPKKNNGQKELTSKNTLHVSVS